MLLVVTWIVPLAVVAVTYTRVGVELWGSKTIGERTKGQDETLKSKRKVLTLTRWTKRNKSRLVIIRMRKTMMF